MKTLPTQTDFIHVAKRKWTKHMRAGWLKSDIKL